MSTMRFKQGFMAGLLTCAAFAFLFGRVASFEPRWRGLKDGMSQAEVMRVLGTPTRKGNGDAIGAGDKIVARWVYRRWRAGRFVDYYVDFDFIGPGGAPGVF